MTTVPPDRSPPTLKVVFFGPPQSGKSSLLDAVSAIARTQSDDLIPLRHADASSPQRSVIRRAVKVDRPGERKVTGDIEFIDCDGNAAQELLENANLLRREKARSELAEQVRSTDALVVVIDASWPPQKVEAVFAQLNSFLKVLRDQRAKDREVGGLPVFLVLGKCDELSIRGETFGDWQLRVEDEKTNLEGRFRDWFGSTGGQFFTFGSTELHVTATATTWPDVIGGLPDSTGGLGIEALHAAVVVAAIDHQNRSVQSRRRLNWTAGVAVGMLTVMLIALVWLGASGEKAAAELLADRVRRIQYTLGPPEVRLSVSRFEANRRELRSVHNSPVFEQLPTSLQQFVNDSLIEFTAYAEYRERFAPPQYAPADVRTAAEWKEVETALGTELTPPPNYADAWRQTEAVLLAEKWRHDLTLLTAAEQEIHGWYTAQLARLTELLTAAVPSEQWSPNGWRTAVGEAVSRQPPFPPGSAVEGSQTVPLPRGEPLTWESAYRYERAAAAAEEWRQTAIWLADIRDLADAVGLTIPSQHPDAVLTLPTAVDLNQSLTMAADRLAKLQDRYPRALNGQAQWDVTRIPGPLQDALGQRLRTVAATGSDQVRRLVANDPATRSGAWANLAAPNGLLLKPEMAAWGELMQRLTNWIDPESMDEDPVQSLTKFVQKTEFRWEMTRITLRMPNALRVNAVSNGGDLVIRVGRGDNQRTYSLKSGRPKQSAASTTIDYVPSTGPISYLPGEEFTAEVTLTDRDGGYTLRWGDARTSAYRFEALLREPTVETVGPNPVPLRANGVRVTIDVAEGSDPFRVPVLLPATR